MSVIGDLTGKINILAGGVIIALAVAMFLWLVRGDLEKNKED